ncbi:hypothetical protein EG329_009355 [Mollisiaceae sp. DMI_Dod_QoI]|nr:hypothetical protein EG329_009355 [Helotiales sp. DMI_Dod_QoI]
MPFPSRGCRTCKQRRVKCDEARPVCNRCQKAKLVCQGVEEDGGFVFLNENEYAVGRRKRPRGPNVNSGSTSRDRSAAGAGNQKPESHGLFRSPHDALLARVRPREPQSFHVAPALSLPMDDQALSYYSRNYIEAPHALSGIMDGHLQCALVDGCYSQPQSILSLAIFAVSYATYGRARRSHAALATGYTKYSKALLKTNLALKDAREATNDEILLAVMLLSYYENSVTEKTSSLSDRGIQAIASRSFAHHDGAMAMLNLRRQLDQRSNKSMALDMLVRRQLLRSVLLRSMPVPYWLRDGSQYGEQGFALEFDRCIVRAVELRCEASGISVDFAPVLSSDSYFHMKLHRLLAEAQSLDDDLITWANALPQEDWYSTHTVQNDKSSNMVFDGTIHIYPTEGHAGMWNRFRAVRLVVNEVILKTMSVLNKLPESNSNAPEEAAKLKTTLLADDICASVPFMLGLIEVNEMAGDNITVVSKTPSSLKFAVKASTASFLCWPLAMATMMSGISCLQHFYLRSRLIDVSEIVDDGVLERIAEGSPKVSHGPVNAIVVTSSRKCQYSGVDTSRSEAGPIDLR